MELSLNNKIENKIEKEQNRFINSNLGRVINTGLNIGIRALMPDLIENEIISIKDAIFKSGLKVRFR